MGSMGKLTVADLFDVTHTRAGDALADLEYPWQVLSQIADIIASLAETLPDDFERLAEDIWVGPGTTIESSVIMHGPAIVGRDCEIRQSALFRGNVLIGDGCVVGNSTEVKNSIIFDSVQVPHFNYVGDSVLGYGSHLGAGAILSNVRLDGANVRLITGEGERIETGLRKFGSLVGDRVEVGCNAVLNPGTVIGKDSIIYPLTNVGGVVPPMSIVKADGSVIVRRT